MNIPASTAGLHESDGAFNGVINYPMKLLERLKLDGSFLNLTSLIFFSKDKSELASVTNISNYKTYFFFIFTMFSKLL